MKRTNKSPYGRWADWVVLLLIAVLLFTLVKFAYYTPVAAKKAPVSLDIKYIPYYAGRSMVRMFLAYILSIVFSLIYGYAAARSKVAERIMLPILDVLQSVPILSFLPVIVLSLTAFIPQNTAAEIASVLLIFTSQAWNLTFCWYQSLTTIPKELKEASKIFTLNPWMQFKKLELPFGFVSLIWNSIMSWAGGWFFLMAAEIFTVGQKQFQLIGLGSYLQVAATEGDTVALFTGVGALILIIILLDQLVWRPLLAWSRKFNLEMVGGTDSDTASWFYPVLRNSKFILAFEKSLLSPIVTRLDKAFEKMFQKRKTKVLYEEKPAPKYKTYIVVAIIGAVVLLFGAQRMLAYLSHISAANYWLILKSALATMLRVAAALVISLLWTIPVGVLIGSNKRMATVLQPLVQVAASVPATALFPVLVLYLLSIPFGLNIAAILLMILGTQWYLLFNVIAGVATIPQDLRYTASLMRLKKWRYWKNLILPALFPFIITGSITASGGAWNASIVAEYVSFHGHNYSTLGLGSLIAESTSSGNYPMLLASTLTMILIVSLVNRFGWRRLYALAKEKYKME